MKIQFSVGLCLVQVLTTLATELEDNVNLEQVENGDRQNKLLPVFQIVRFPVSIHSLQCIEEVHFT